MAPSSNVVPVDFQAQLGNNEIDMTSASLFLSCLDEENEQHNFRTFSDNKDDPTGAVLAKKYIGTIESRGRELAAKNKKNAGVFVVVNSGGQDDASISRIRAVFADTDGAPLEPLLQCGIAPQMIVESSPGNYHVYWFVDGLSPEQFTGVQKTIAARFGCDSLVHNPSRVMRVPGFFHCKDGNRFRSRIFQETPSRPYSAEEILAVFPPETHEALRALPAANSERKVHAGMRNATMVTYV